MRFGGIDVMTAPAQQETPLLEMKNVVKEYRGVAALKGIDFDLRRGEAHSILGENGAGKSTLVKILSGAVAPSSGEILLDGQTIQISGPASARRHGIAMVYQETSLVPTLTVAQNLIWAMRSSSTASGEPTSTLSKCFSR
jgi:simple sugar transport system ATP-binding protein